MNDSKRSIKFAKLAYSTSLNLGDQIQTLATEKFLGYNPVSIERHELNKYDGEKVIMLMQGYFYNDKNHCAFPPSKNIIPVFIGFHIESASRTAPLYSSKEYIDYLKKYEPIGCRDESTMQFLLKRGVKAYLSRCLTLTFPIRDNSIKGNKIFFVDEPKWMKFSCFFGKKFRKMYEKGVFLTQIVDEEPVGVLSDEDKRQMAIDRLNLLKSEAKLVITSRLHIASPCVAMGIPVLLFPEEGSGWNRYKTLEGIISVYTFSPKFFRFLGKFRKIASGFIRTIYIHFFMNWYPVPPNIEDIKENLIENTKKAINETINKWHC